MNISRVAVLTVLFSAPIFSMDTPLITPVTTEAKSYFASAKELAVKPFDYIANKSYLNTLIAKITTTKYLNDTFVNNPAIIGRVIVLAAATVAAYKAYTMYNTEDAVEASEDFFSDDNN